jgi:hypothetical protein
MIQLELAFGALVTLWLVVEAGVAHPLTVETAFVTAGLALVTSLCGESVKPNVKRLFYVARYGFVLWAYLATARLVPALHRAPRDATLLGLDRFLFGETPALAFDLSRHPLVVEGLTAAYLAYQPYLHLCLLWALLAPDTRAPRLARLVFSTLILGYVGYLLVPAVGPFAAIASLSVAPLDHGPLARLNLDIVKTGGAIYDVFPSLHTAVTLVLLAHDRCHAPWRFRVMAPIATVLIPATMLLRFHYAVDVLCGVALAVTARCLDALFERRGEPSGA